MRAEALADDPTSQHTLQQKLARLSVRLPAGRSSSPIAAKVSRRWFALPTNDRGLQAVALDLTPRAPALLVRTPAGETRTPLGIGSWTRSATGFANGIERLLSVPAPTPVALSGAWTSDSVFTVKLLAPETPYYSTMTFRFDGDRLLLDAEHNVSFGPTKLPRLEGTPARGR
jgi:hypothetical protein